MTPTENSYPTSYEVVRAYYELPHEYRDLKGLAKKLGLSSADGRAITQRLSKKIADWERKGLVKHHVLKGHEDYLFREPDLEDRLLERFALRGALVVDMAPLSLPQGSPESYLDGWNEYDDKIHQHLGVWGGRLLSLMLRPEDNIAIGGGRGPHYAVENMPIPRPARHRGDVIALTGQMSTRVWRPKAGRQHHDLIDADFLASNLYSFLSSAGKLRQLHCSITENRKPPVTNDVDIAVVGVGALGGGHRLRQHQNLEDVKTVADLLTQLNKVSEEIESQFPCETQHFWHPVGDVCNWYFVVDDANKKHEKDVKRLVVALNKLVQALNKKFVNTNSNQLAEIAERGAVIAIAGGPHKLAALRHVLSQGTKKAWITHIVTDKETALELAK